MNGLLAEELNLALLDHGSEYLNDIVEVACGTVDYICKTALLKLFLEEILCVKHGDVRSEVSLDNRDVCESLNACCLSFFQKIKVTLVVDLVVCNLCGSTCKTYCCDNCVCAITKALKCFGICNVDLFEGVVTLKAKILFDHVGCNNLMTLFK